MRKSPLSGKSGIRLKVTSGDLRSAAFCDGPREAGCHVHRRRQNSTRIATRNPLGPLTSQGHPRMSRQRAGLSRHRPHGLFHAERAVGKRPNKAHRRLPPLFEGHSGHRLFRGRHARRRSDAAGQRRRFSRRPARHLSAAARRTTITRSTRGTSSSSPRTKTPGSRCASSIAWHREQASFLASCRGVFDAVT